MTTTRQHGMKGVYLGGEWVDIEQCADLFNNKKGTSTCATEKCTTCPRSRTTKRAAKKDGSYDVVIIGAGCIGASIARELSKTTLRVLLLEAADDVTQGATKGNSGIVHAGYDDKPGTNRAKFCWPGNQMFPQLDKELRFGYQRNGSMVLAFTEQEVEHLQELIVRGETNGVRNLEILGREEVLSREPHVDPNVKAALFSPDAGNLIPYEFAIALAENAADNGVEVRIRRKVVGISVAQDGGFVVKADHWEPKNYLQMVEVRKEKLKKKKMVSAATAVAILATAWTFLTKESGEAVPITAWVLLLVTIILSLFLISTLLSKSNSTNSIPDPVGSGGSAVTPELMLIGGSGSSEIQDGKLVETELIHTRYVINAAGGYSDKIANMIGDHSFKIKPRLGEYILLNRDQGSLATCTLFPCPSILGKGILVQNTLWGNLILGPTARDVHDPVMMAKTPEEIQQFIISNSRKLVPEFDASHVIHTFSGARAKSDRGDWIIEPSEKHSGFINVAGIDSPGIAGCPAIALEAVRLLQAAAGVASFPPNPSFNPNRAPIIIPKDSFKGLRIGPKGKYTNPKENVVCKCEKVTEAEVVEAIRRSLPVDSTQAVRKRTRAGMGHCQADVENYNCEARVAEIIARELGVPVESVGRRPWPATSTLPHRWLTEEEKKGFEAMGK